MRLQRLVAGERTIELVSRPKPAQSRVLSAFGVDTSAWGKAAIVA